MKSASVVADLETCIEPIGIKDASSHSIARLSREIDMYFLFGLKCTTDTISSVWWVNARLAQSVLVVGTDAVEADCSARVMIIVRQVLRGVLAALEQPRAHLFLHLNLILALGDGIRQEL